MNSLKCKGQSSLGDGSFCPQVLFQSLLHHQDTEVDSVPLIWSGEIGFLTFFLGTALAGFGSCASSGAGILNFF